MDCLFCKIIRGEIPANIQYQDEKVAAFVDINPQAPVHTVIVPKQHIATLNDLQPDNFNLIGYMVNTAKNLAKEFGIAEQGYRVLMNCNDHGGQTVFHIHLHLLGGRHMHWPPG